MSKRKHSHGIEDEPGLRSLTGKLGRRAAVADELGEEPVRAGPGADLNVEQDHTQALGDEPALRWAMLNEETAPGFAQIYRSRRAGTTATKRWLAIAVAAVLSGPCAVGAAFVSNSAESNFMVLAVCVFGPLVEEMLKVSGVLYLVEQRPWLIPSRLSVVLTATVSGLVFAILENYWYLSVLIDDPTPGIVLWRWTVCIVLHAGCSTIAGLGVARIWSTSHRSGRLPRISLGSPYLITAVVIHGIYNFSAYAFEFTSQFMKQ